MGDIKIDEIQRQLADLSMRSRLSAQPQSSNGPDFSQMLEQAVDKVNQELVAADQSMQNYVSGKETSLHGTLIAIEKADVSFKLMMQVRGKLIEAYQEVMRTTV